LGQPHTQYSNIGDISGNYERIATKYSGICLLTRVMSSLLGEKMLK